jgi:hypothetical protein
MKKDVLYPTYVLIGLLIVVAGILFFVYQYSSQNIPAETQPVVSEPVTIQTKYDLSPEQVQQKQAVISQALQTQKVTLTKDQADAKLKLLKQLQGN